MWVRLRLSQQTFEGLKNLKTWSDVIPKKVRKIIDVTLNRFKSTWQGTKLNVRGWISLMDRNGVPCLIFQANIYIRGRNEISCFVVWKGINYFPSTSTCCLISRGTCVMWPYRLHVTDPESKGPYSSSYWGLPPMFLRETLPIRKTSLSLSPVESKRTIANCLGE